MKILDIYISPDFQNIWQIFLFNIVTPLLYTTFAYWQPVASATGNRERQKPTDGLVRTSFVCSSSTVIELQIRGYILNLVGWEFKNAVCF